MLVCPSCRSENTEDASVCRHCGNGLDPTSSPMRRIERSSEEEPQIDLMPARKTSAWPIVIAGLVVGLALLGWGLLSALRPNPCAGKYSSALFSYCADIPEGWVGGSSFNPGGNLDRFQRLSSASEPEAEESPDSELGPAPLSEATVEAETTVEVTQLLDPNVSTPQYAQQFRTSQQATGFDPSPVESVLIDGEQALAWDLSEEGDVAADPLHFRIIVLVRSEGAWEIRFVSTEESYDIARIDLEEMLASWRWKG